ncbi:MAG: hypothetical protein QXQ02_10710, partial [Halobacteria archaeon]
MVKKILVMVLVVWCIVVLRGGVPAECQSKLRPGCFTPASYNDPDSPEDKEIRDILYDATVQFLKDIDAKGGGGKGLTEIACDIAAELMCFASGVEDSVNGGQVRRMIGVPQKVWRKMLKENPFVPRRLLAAIWQAAARNVEQIDFSTPEIKNAFADIRRLWKRGGRGGGGGIASTGGSKSSASGRAARSVGRSSFPRSGDFVRRPPVAFTRPISQPAGGSSGQAGGIQQGDGEIPASPPVTQGPLQPPTTGGASTPSGTGAPTGGQGQGLNICLFCVPQQSNQQQQQQNQPPSNKQQQGGQNNQQSGCTCIVDGQRQSGTGTDRPILRSILAKIDGKLSRTENTPKDEITLEEFRNGLSTLIGVAKRNGVSDNTINADNTLGLASQGGIMELLWISPTICKVGGSDGYSDKECVPDRLGDINAHLSKCPYIVLKNLRMCLDLNRKNDEISKELLVLVDKVIKKVLEDDDSLLKKLRDAHRNMKTFITACGGQVSSIAAVIRNKVQSSQCASATAAVKNNALNAVKAMEVLLRNVAPRPGKAPGTCFSKDTAIVPRNFHAAILDGLDSYKVLPGFTPLVAIIPEIEFKECVIDDKSTNAYSLIKGDNVININTSLADVFAALLGIKNMQEEMDVRKKGNTGKCFDINDDRRIKELFSACGELQDLSLPICAAAGLAKWARSKEVPLYTYPMAGDASNPFLKIYKYCSYVPDSDKWPSSSGDSLTTFEHSTMAKNLLLCMIYKAFNEGYSQSMSKKGGTIPQLA